MPSDAARLHDNDADSTGLRIERWEKAKRWNAEQDRDEAIRQRDAADAEVASLSSYVDDLLDFVEWVMDFSSDEKAVAEARLIWDSTEKELHEHVRRERDEAVGLLGEWVAGIDGVCSGDKLAWSGARDKEIYVDCGECPPCKTRAFLARLEGR